MNLIASRHDQKNLAIGAAAGMVAGLAANFVRKAVVQAPAMMAGDWADALVAEHKAALAIFDRLEASDDMQVTKRATLLMQLKHALTKHTIEEENAVYASLRDNGQKEAADHLNHEHGYVKQYLYDLEIMPKSHSRWLPMVREFRGMIEQHMREEENEVFPRLKARLSVEENRALSRAVNREGIKLA
ncbi:hemerythrin [Sphingomonas oleivorans]|uniref:Hemerythrin n=1 Tax=Sphingomonas oleivorans TaxID=1735121 RepID=A0A2T5FVY6_9SPHN|nr:hemerythrin domain-containing protein [Sphingomonas oleivorans]PTQ09941.1 hemerythrin [Sphingomonas oleivorans]